MTITEIIPGLLVGNVRDAESHYESHKGFVYVDCRGLSDDGKMGDKFKFFNLFHQIKSIRQNIFIYCQAGHNRSVMMVIAQFYHLNKGAWVNKDGRSDIICKEGHSFTLQDALDHINQKREEVYVHPYWAKFLMVECSQGNEIHACITCKHCEEKYDWCGECGRTGERCYYLKKCEQWEKRA